MRSFLSGTVTGSLIMVFGVVNGQTVFNFNDSLDFMKQAELRLVMMDNESDSIGQTEKIFKTEHQSGLKKPGLGILMSAAIPGTGEMYAGSWIKGGIMLGIEAALWMGYVKYWDEGNDLTEEYEAYANEHWSEERWDRQEGTHTLPDTKTQQYYEMIGKYHQFKTGWDDYDPDGPDMTTNRTLYMDMRENSNIAFRKAFYFSMVSLANHVFSALDAAWTIRNVNRKFETGIRMGLNRFDGGWIPQCTLSVVW